MGLRGLAAGIFSLIVLHALVARANQNQLTGLVATGNGLLQRFLDPNVPAIPEKGEKRPPAALTAVANRALAANQTVQSAIPSPTKR